MGDHVVVQVEIADVLNGAIVARDSVHLEASFVEGISSLPFVLGENAQSSNYGKDDVRLK